MDSASASSLSKFQCFRYFFRAELGTSRRPSWPRHESVGCPRAFWHLPPAAHRAVQHGFTWLFRPGIDDFDAVVELELELDRAGGTAAGARSPTRKLVPTRRDRGLRRIGGRVHPSVSIPAGGPLRCRERGTEEIRRSLG